MGMLYEYDATEREAMGLNQRSEAYHTGYQAHAEGEGLDRNPYASPTNWEREEWIEGWNAY